MAFECFSSSLTDFGVRGGLRQASQNGSRPAYCLWTDMPYGGNGCKLHRPIRVIDCVNNAVKEDRAFHYWAPKAFKISILN